MARILEPQREVTRRGRKLHNEELQMLRSLFKIIRVFISRIEWAVYGFM
jgi:hypothetical protein